MPRLDDRTQIKVNKMVFIRSIFYLRGFRSRFSFVWIIPIILSAFFLLCYMNGLARPEHTEDVPFGEKYTMDVIRVNLPKYEKVSKAKSRQNVLINSYMSSGSTYLGQVLGFRNDTFYFYEPLWYFGLWKFYESPNKECDVRGSLTCRKITSAQLNDNKYTSKDMKYRSGDTYFGRDDFTVVDINKFYQTNVRYDPPTDLLIDVLTDIYTCDLRRLSNLVVSNVHPLPQYGGPSWEVYRTCIRKAPNSKGKCLKKLEEKCKSADHVVTKVLRITSGSLETLLERFDNLKVLHLYRDPRAVVNSRMKWTNYPVGNVFQNARILCDKMLVDLLGGIKMVERFKNRFKFIFYEDILLETTEKVTVLFDFLGMQHITANTKTNIRNDQCSTSSECTEELFVRKANNAFWWRYSLSYDMVNLIHSQCRDITVIFNMTHFKNAILLQNMSTPSIVLPNFFKLIQL